MLTKHGVPLELEAQMAARSTNYRALMRLMPDWRECSDFYFACPGGGESLELHLSLLERATYTLTLGIQQRLDGDSLPVGWLHDMKVRIYLDVRSSEVIHWGGQRLEGWAKERQTRRANYREKAHSDMLLSEQLRLWSQARCTRTTPLTAAEAGIQA